MAGIVIDANMVGRKLAPIVDQVRAGARIVVIETLIAEQCRAQPETCEQYLRNDLAPLRPVIAQVDFVEGLNRLVQLEFDAPGLTSPLIDPGRATWFRGLLYELLVGEGPTLKQFRAAIGDYARGVASYRYDHDANKARAIEGIDAFIASVGRQVPDFRERLQKGDHELLLEAVAKFYALYGWGRVLGLGINVPDVRMLPDLGSPAAMSLLVVCADRLLWIAEAGAHGRKAWKFSNDDSDHHYITVALLGGFELRTNDGRTARLMTLCQDSLQAFRRLESLPTRAQALATVFPIATP